MYAVSDECRRREHRRNPPNVAEENIKSHTSRPASHTWRRGRSDAWKETRPFTSFLNAPRRKRTRLSNTHNTSSSGSEMHSVSPLPHVVNIWQVSEPCGAVCIDNLGGFGARKNGNGSELHSNEGIKVSTGFCTRGYVRPSLPCWQFMFVFISE